MNYIRFNHLFHFRQRTILDDTTYKFINNVVVQSSVSIKITYKISHTTTSTSNNTKGSTIMSAKSTRNTPQLFTIITPFATTFVHVMFKLSNRHTPKTCSITPVIVHVDNNLVFTSHITSFTCEHTCAATPLEKHMFWDDIGRLDQALDILADSRMPLSWRPHTPLPQTFSRSDTSVSQKLQIVEHLDNFRTSPNSANSD